MLHIFVTKQCARTVFGLGNPKWPCSNNINQRAGVNMNFGVSFVCDVLNDDLILRNGRVVYLDQFCLTVLNTFSCLMVTHLLNGLMTAQL